MVYSQSERTSNSTDSICSTFGGFNSSFMSNHSSRLSNNRSISFLEYKKLRFAISDSPTDQNLPDYLKEFKRFGVSDLVRVCQPTYDDSKVEEEGIVVHGFFFADGGVPSATLIRNWLNLVRSNLQNESSSSAIAVHCVAGLGRAPVLVALALIELYGMEQLDAIEFIRKHRRGAFNSRQIEFLASYRKKSSNHINYFGFYFRNFKSLFKQEKGQQVKV